MNTEEWLRQTLRREKHERVEGFCSEDYFCDKIMNPNFSFNYSTGWLFEQVEGKWHAYLMSEDLSMVHLVDKGFAEFLSQHMDVTLVLRNGSLYGWKRYEGQYSWANDRLILYTTFWNTRSQPPKQDKERFDMAIEYLMDHGCTNEIIFKRGYINICGDSHLYDLDALVGLGDLKTGTAYYGAGGEPFVVLEVKHKYPAGVKGHQWYGINKGSHGLYQYLYSLGVKGVYMILTKPRNKKNSPMQFFPYGEWLIVPWSEMFQYTETGVAPVETSLYRDREVGYFKIPAAVFQKIDPSNVRKYVRKMT